MLMNVKVGGIRYVEIFCIESKARVWGLFAGGQWGLGGGSPDAAAIMYLFSKKFAYLGVV